MRTGRYPLTAARDQRDLAQKGAEAQLRAARDRLHGAQLALQSAEARVASLLHERSTVLTATAEATPQPAHDLMRRAAYACRLQRQVQPLAEQLRTEQQAVAQHARAVRLAELTLHEAHKQHELIERHHNRFQDAERKARAQHDELESEELQQRAAFATNPHVR